MRHLESALRLRDLLRIHGQRLVLVESCTAGRIAAALGTIPGISSCFCGSQVVYRNASKSGWLGISPELLTDPHIGPVSEEVTRRLAEAALEQTPEADVCLAITGEIGPAAPPEKDGVVFCAVRLRSPSLTACEQHRLSAPAPASSEDYEGRLLRLNEATELALVQAATMFQSK